MVYATIWCWGPNQTVALGLVTKGERSGEVKRMEEGRIIRWAESGVGMAWVCGKIASRAREPIPGILSDIW